MGNILQKTVLASIGAFQITRKKAEEVIDHLIKTGEVSKSERKQAIMELLDKADKSTADFRAKVSKEATRVSDKVSSEVTKAVGKLSVARKDDVAELNKKFDKLLKAVERLDKKVSGSAR